MVTVPSRKISVNDVVLITRPHTALRAAFVIVGGLFLLVGVYLGFWAIIPVGLIAIGASGIRHQVTAIPEQRVLNLISSAWGMTFRKTSIAVGCESLLIGQINPAGSGRNGGIALNDTYSLHVETNGVRITVVELDHFPAWVRNDARQLAQLLDVPYQEEIA